MDFFDWSVPSTLLQNTKDKNPPGEILFNNPKLQKNLEAYAAALFAKNFESSGQTRVRLVRNDPPDFEMLQGNSVHKFELVEADELGRRRGDEYRELAKKIESDEFIVTHVNPDLEVARIIPVIASRVAKKAAKKYPPDINLVVYVNVWHPYDFDDVISGINAMIISDHDVFRSIWLLWNGHVVRVWPKPSANPGRIFKSGREAEVTD